MKTPRSFLIPAAIFASFAAIGWLAGRGKAPAAGSLGTDASSTRETKTVRASREKKAAIPAEMLERLAPIRAAKTTEERMRATIHLAQTLPLADIKAWHEAEWFDGREDMQSYFFHRITRARWLEADPAGLMEYCLTKDSDRTSEVPTAWATRDPAGALAFVQETKDISKLSNMLSQMASSLANANPSLAAESISGLYAKLGPQYSHSIDYLIQQLAKSSPDLLEGHSADWPPALKKVVASNLAQMDLKRDFAGTIAELSQSKDGKRDFLSAIANDRDLAKKIAADPESLPPGWFGEVASSRGFYVVEDNPEKWLNADLSALGMTAEQAQRLRGYAINKLGSKDPDAVMAMLSNPDLSAEDRNSALQTAASFMAKDKEKAEAWLATMSDENDIKMAKQILASNQDNNSNKEVTPSDMLSQLAEEGTSLSWQHARAAGAWSSEDRETVAREFAALPPEQKPVVALKFLNGHYEQFPYNLRADALTYLLSNPSSVPEGDVPREKRPMVQYASQVAASWAEEDPGAAGNWVSSLPSGEERLWAAKNLAARWAEYEPAATRRWIAGLPANERAQVQEYLDAGQARNP